MSTWPSAARAMSSCSRISSRACTARATLSTTRCAVAAADSSSAGATRSSGSIGSIPGVVLLRHKNRLNCVQDGARDLGLPGPRHLGLATGRDDRDLVLGRVEADPRLGDVVEDHGVEALALQLVARRLQ